MKPRRRAFTLVEVTVTVMILGIVSACVAPIVFSAGETYANAANVRRTAEKSAYAMERIVRVLRDSPGGATRGTLAIANAAPTLIRYTDGHGLELTSGTLYERSTDGVLSPLCDGVSSFIISYLASDGVTNSSAAPTTTQRFNITLVCNTFELRSGALARVRVVDP